MVLSASATDPSQWTQVGQLGIGALVAVPFSVGCSVLWKSLQKEREKSDLLQLARVQDAKDAVIRERDLADHLVPLLSQAAELLSTAPARFDRALSQATDATRSNELETAVRRLEQSADRLARGS